MKIPLQEKIAELEARISGLEERERLRAGIYSQQQTVSIAGGGVPSARMRHWHKMWEEFNLAMKEIFE